MRIACISMADLPDWEVDDRPLHAALRARDVDLHVVPWTADMDWAGFDGLLIRTPWDYADRADDFLAWVDRASRLTRLWHDADVVRWNLHKTYLRDLHERGVPLAPTAWVDRPDQIRAAVAEHGWQRAFLKPVVGCAASDTLRFDTDAAGVAAAEAHVAAAGQAFLLQPYLARVETDGETSVVVVDGEPTHAVRKVPVPGDYRVQDDFGASDHGVPLTASLAAFARTTLAAARAQLGRDAPFLYARVDLLEHDGDWVLNELEVVEPSMFFRHGPHAAEALADAVVRRVRNTARPPRVGGSDAAA